MKSPAGLLTLPRALRNIVIRDGGGCGGDCEACGKVTLYTLRIGKDERFDIYCWVSGGRIGTKVERVSGSDVLSVVMVCVGCR